MGLQYETTAERYIFNIQLPQDLSCGWDKNRTGL